MKDLIQYRRRESFDWAEDAENEINDETDSFCWPTLHSARIDEHQEMTDPPVLDRSHSNQKPLEDHELDTTCRTVDDVFHFRTHYCRSNPDFRHFNWSGEPASTRSATLPAEFLAIILSNPKALDPNKGLRIPSVLRRASKFIDSVVVNLANTDEGLLSLRGPQLQHAATGYVRCPSTHGWWLVESREDHDLDLDTSNSAHYLMSNLAIANGFTRGRIRTASGWAKTRQDIFTVRSKPRPREDATVLIVHLH
ncbi:hypothetical protein N7526_001292 [Penicillium atrosanguineum]|nr:hypothetical protein N7526_001292 [Penicillium atrosanguineum]